MWKFMSLLAILFGHANVIPALQIINIIVQYETLPLPTDIMDGVVIHILFDQDIYYSNGSFPASRIPVPMLTHGLDLMQMGNLITLLWNDTVFTCSRAIANIPHFLLPLPASKQPIKDVRFTLNMSTTPVDPVVIETNQFVFILLLRGSSFAFQGLKNMSNQDFWNGKPQLVFATSLLGPRFEGVQQNDTLNSILGQVQTRINLSEAMLVHPKLHTNTSLIAGNIIDKSIIWNMSNSIFYTLLSILPVSVMGACAFLNTMQKRDLELFFVSIRYIFAFYTCILSLVIWAQINLYTLLLEKDKNKPYATIILGIWILFQYIKLFISLLVTLGFVPKTWLLPGIQRVSVLLMSIICWPDQLILFKDATTRAFSAEKINLLYKTNLYLSLAHSQCSVAMLLAFVLLSTQYQSMFTLVLCTTFVLYLAELGSYLINNTGQCH